MPARPRAHAASAQVTGCVAGNRCTEVAGCARGKCAGKAKKCDDGNTCTTDACVPTKGCTYAKKADGLTCNDGQFCTTTDVCAAGKCLGKAKSCDDGKVCTQDSCVGNACKHASLNGKQHTCEDGDKCTTSTWCQGGTCSVKGKAVFHPKNNCKRCHSAKFRKRRR